MAVTYGLIFFTDGSTLIWYNEVPFFTLSFVRPRFIPSRPCKPDAIPKSVA